MNGIHRIVILGGGSAGWMAACLMAQRWLGKHAARPVEITLVESPAIGIIGVGEGSTPQLKAFFDRLDIAEGDWMPACDATYKLGIRFHGWSERPGFERYFHPFPSRIDVHTQPHFQRACALQRSGIAAPAHPDRWFLPTALADAKLGPHADRRFPFDLSYGYHFDAHKLGAYLRDQATAKGVRHLERRVIEVEQAENGDIAALLCEGGERLEGDFFIDSSGFAAVLAEKTLGTRFLPFAENLFNDRAVVLPTPAATDGMPIATSATALSAGWAWPIPLTSRTGNGYVYSSGHLSDDAAETELRRHTGTLDGLVEARHLRMKVGRLEDSWRSNCLAIGLAQGFLEPLEATALHIVLATMEEFIAAYEAGGFAAQHRGAFNTRIARRYEGIRDYIVAHYRLNQRGGEYWREAAAMDTLSDDLKAMMTTWFTGQDLNATIDRLDIGRFYASLSWHCLFAGYGSFPNQSKLREGAYRFDISKTADFLDRAALNFASHDVQLSSFRTHQSSCKIGL